MSREYTTTNDRVQGLSELNRVLQQLPDVMQRRVFSSAVGAGARLLKKELIQAAPVGPSTEEIKSKSYLYRRGKYGRIRDNIKIRTRSNWPRRRVVSTIHNGRAFWGYFKEFGTSKETPKPWFRPVWDTQNRAIYQRMVERVAKGLSREAKKLAGSYSKSGLMPRRRR